MAKSELASALVAMGHTLSVPTLIALYLVDCNEFSLRLLLIKSLETSVDNSDFNRLSLLGDM